MDFILESKGACRYFGGLKAVDEVDMQVQKGEIFGIIGPNGAGKSTFFNLCSGVYQTTKGSIFLNGERIDGLRSEQIAVRGLARTFQNIHLFRYMSVLDNVKIGCHIDTKSNLVDAVLHTARYRKDEAYAEKRTLEILDQVGLAQYAQVLAGNLPYGLQRKVEIARALAFGPQILLLDEPVAGMNPNETRELAKLIREINGQGVTIVVIEHDMKFIMNLCDRILVINFGKKICEGNPDEVKSNPLVNEAYFGKSQLKMD